MGERLRVGLIGTGRIGRMHADHLAYRVPEACLVAVADLNREAAEACARACGITDVAEDYCDILARSDVDAVVICTSSPTHTRLIIDSAAAGKHIFCEKPIDIVLQQIDRAIDAAESAGVVLQIGFQRRFDPSFRRIREAVLSREIGEPHLLHLVSRDPAPPPVAFLKSSGGLFLDMMIHDFDMVGFLLDSTVETVYSEAAVRIDPAIGEVGDVDTAVVVLRFGCGAIGTIDNSRKATYGYDQRAEVFGSKGSIRMQNAYPNTTTVSTAVHVRRNRPYHFFLERYREAFIQELRAFARAVLDGLPSPVSGADARKPVVIGLAAQRSHEEGRPVSLAEIDGSA